VATNPGVYVHVPFCVHRCDYCDFAVTPGADAAAMRRYVAALRTEIDRVTPPRGGWPAFGSVFVGGGTPTLLEPEQLAGVLRHLRKVLPIADAAEITVEANPETVNGPGLRVLVAAGLTRVSLGAQSFDAGVLSTLGRRHAADATAAAVAHARRAGVAQVSLDLIYGTPLETEAQWRSSLQQAIDLGVEHVSCYALTVESNTPFAARIRRGDLPTVDDDIQAERMGVADELLSAAGLRRYEVSNWARPGCESRHNRNYWHGGDWLAFGASAHGHWGGRRWWNVRPTDRYIAEVEAGRSPVAGQEVLDPASVRTERLLTALRTVEGVSRDDVEPLDPARLERLVAAGLMRDTGERLALTPAGLAVAGGIAADLV
jgi:putative oxygen-independent coproporphyrinogen III oxidase